MAELAEEHQELFHYTGINGLEGIIKNQTLWATHASFLNDTTEIHAFKKRLPDILRPEIKYAVDEWLKLPVGREHIELQGGAAKVIDDLIKDFANEMYDALHNAAKTEPYIASFCTTKNDRIKQHGLLSQWRGYGQDGGYAIVFDTAQLVNLMNKEEERWSYRLIRDNVVYSSCTDEKIRDELGDDIDKILTSISNLLKSPSPEHCENIYDPLVSCACRYKHWGFHEEKEVRIVAILHPREVIDEQKALSKEKERQHFIRGGMLVPCIHLFEGITQLPDNPLPIKRIMVGPHRDQEKRQHAVESLLSQHQLNIPVTVSDIPYVGYF